MSEEVKRSFKWLVYWSWQRRGIRHRWTLKGITMVSTCYDRTLKHVRSDAQNKFRGGTQVFWKRQKTVKRSWDLKSSVWGVGNIPHFSFFFPHAEGVKSQAPFDGLLSFPKPLQNWNLYPFELKWLYSPRLSSSNLPWSGHFILRS